MIKQFGFQITAFIFITITTGLFAETFEWQGRVSEPSFALEVPADWERDSVSGSNGSILFFRDDNAVIEIRSIQMSEKLEFDRLLNLKAARLSSAYPGIQQVDERKSPYRENLYLASFELRDKKKIYRELTAFLIDDTRLISVSCLAPRDVFNSYRTVFDNAIFSLKFTEKKEEPLTDRIADLKKFFFTNVPYANRSEDATEKTDNTPEGKEPVDNTPESTTETTGDDKEDGFIDDFLPKVN